ncbi:ATP-dependent DNA helicase [Sulfidibacter corallicola]|uniref:ATP-dependent DNA helicase n=1 Tax=Sulfidibacter corallicola TaxID=2818388 RepID=A0A8A4TIZ9_SULCO|nr:ATP-dependent DNA helicase [Sulfidibacter corallicola]QTD49467.1 ATP-dependent DNA helicase [Sulfidibacter corallicola]
MTAAEKPCLAISVRDLVYFALRGGDLFQHYFQAPSGLQGIRGHQRLQRKRGEGYRAEVSVKLHHDCGPFELVIGGRIDGVFAERAPVVIEEIKTTLLEFDRIPPHATSLHLGQAKLYAYIYAREHELDEAAVRLTYLHLEHDETREIESILDFHALTVFFNEVIETYREWAETQFAWRQERDRSIADLEFPLGGFRPGQRRLAAEVYRAARDGRTLFAEAPTGTGKTLATLFPAIKAVAEGHVEKVFFLTAKNTGREAAQRAHRILTDSGLRYKALTLTAKDAICFHENGPCRIEQCEYTRGYYDRVRDALTDLFASDALHREAIVDVARRHRVCPFELSLDMAVWADLVICDYNYAFDPGVYLRRFFGEDKSTHMLLIDEAHNLIDRARGMFTAELSKREVLEVRRTWSKRAPMVRRALNGVNRQLLKMGREMDAAGLKEQTLTEAPKALIPPLQKLVAAYSQWLTEAEPGLFGEEPPELFRTVRQFLRCAEHYGDHFATIYRRRGKDLAVKVYCKDPAPQLKARLAKVRAATYFSATLTPFGYHRALLAAKERDPQLRLPSPFDPNHLCLLVADGISVRFRDRERTLGDVVSMIRAVTHSRSGNYLIFLPSYRYLNLITENFAQKHDDVEILIQEPGMDEAQRIAFLKEFEERDASTLVGFAVMGGIFGEGIDLRGERLIGVIVVGVGLPQICIERNLIREHFEENGFDFAYRVPGMQRVLQTAGRVIRTERDRGVVCLIDSRFSEPDYARLFPAHWRPERVRHAAQVTERLARFWSAEADPDEQPS